MDFIKLSILNTRTKEAKTGYVLPTSIAAILPGTDEAGTDLLTTEGKVFGVSETPDEVVKLLEIY